jgi:SPP1 gp7 family putative phage head morphogenesis protein
VNQARAERDRYESSALRAVPAVAGRLAGRVLAALEARLRRGGLRSAAAAPLLGAAGRAELAAHLGGVLAGADLLARNQIVRQAAGKISAFAAPDPRAIQVEPVPMTEALDYWRGRVPLTREQLAALGNQYRQYVFTVAQAADAETTARVGSLIERALAEGTGEKEFVREAGKLIRDVEESYLRTVYQTNMSTAYMAGRWKQLQSDPGIRALLSVYRYVTMGDMLVRPNHAALDGFTAPESDPAWRTIWPPNGYNCRCDTLAVTEGEAARSGWEMSPGIPADGGADPGFDFNPGIEEEAVLDALKEKVSFADEEEGHWVTINGAHVFIGGGGGGEGRTAETGKIKEKSPHISLDKESLPRHNIGSEAGAGAAKQEEKKMLRVTTPTGMRIEIEGDRVRVAPRGGREFDLAGEEFQPAAEVPKIASALRERGLDPEKYLAWDGYQPIAVPRADGVGDAIQEIKGRVIAREAAESERLARPEHVERRAISALYDRAERIAAGGGENNVSEPIQIRQRAAAQLAAWREKYPAAAREEKAADLLAQAEHKRHLASGARAYSADGWIGPAERAARADALLREADQLEAEAKKLRGEN